VSKIPQRGDSDESRRMKRGGKLAGVREKRNGHKILALVEKPEGKKQI
jgi:hypothetical protein